MRFAVRVFFAQLLLAVVAAGAVAQPAPPIQPAPGASSFRSGHQAPQVAPAPADHVVLISLDGLRPEFYLDQSWPAPALRRMAGQGVLALGVRSIFPSVTYPAHTTMVTGVLPDAHGILYNEPFIPDRAPSGDWYFHFDSVRTRTLWQAVAEAGGTTAAFSWPVTVGAPIDWNVPEIWRPGAFEERIAVMRRHDSPDGFMEELERNATGALVAWDSTGATTAVDQWWWDARTADMAEYTLSRYTPTLTAVHVLRTDGAQHDHGREHPEVREAVALADRVVGRLVDAAQRAGILERTAFVVTGDHGFLDREQYLAPNVWLVEAGLRDTVPDRGDWRATFHPASGSMFLMLRDRDDQAALERVRTILQDQPPEIRRLYRIVERKELDRWGVDPRAALALTAVNGGYFTGRATGEVLSPASGGGHGFHPGDDPRMLTGFVAWGAGVGSGVVVERMELGQVAGVVAALLGLEGIPGARELPPGLLQRGR